MHLAHVVIVRPAGNDTALVFDDIPADRYKQANDYIMSKHANVEQVMFVKQTDGVIYGNMAGGEFCGNATRSLGYYMLGGKDGEIQLKISGASSPLTVVVKNGKAKTSMPIHHDLGSVERLSSSSYKVSLEGITHLVFLPSSQEAKDLSACADVAAQKEYARALLHKHGLMDELACGVMGLADAGNGQLSMLPFVYVKAIDTFFAETACGSGSVATGLVYAKRDHRDIQQLSIKQPSGQAILVDINLQHEKFDAAYIDGSVAVLYDGNM